MINPSPTLYLAWQDTLGTRQWFVVGRLRKLPDQTYDFVYTKGYEEAQKLSNMQPILGFMDGSRRYTSDKLFPLFKNRIMSPSREEYPAHIEQLGLSISSNSQLEPLQILARSGGRRTTDSFEVFPAPSEQRLPDGKRYYVISFFVHGIRYVPTESQRRASRCDPGERLLLLSDWQNHTDKNALMLRTELDNHLLGWLPRYYCSDINTLRERNVSIEVKVERANSPESPLRQRVLCCLNALWPDGFSAFSTSEYEPLVEEDYDFNYSDPSPN